MKRPPMGEGRALPNLRFGMNIRKACKAPSLRSIHPRKRTTVVISKALPTDSCLETPRGRVLPPQAVATTAIEQRQNATSYAAMRHGSLCQTHHPSIPRPDQHRHVSKNRRHWVAPSLPVRWISINLTQIPDQFSRHTHCHTVSIR